MNAFREGMFVRGLALTGLFVIWSANALQADSIVFKDSLELLPTGTISYGGGSDPLVGTDIQIRDVIGPDGVKHAVHLFDSLGTGILDFETGDFVGMLGSTLVFGPSGLDDFIQIFGTVPEAGVKGPPTPLLLSGTVVLADVDPQLGKIKLGFELGAGDDQLNPELLAYFGLPPDTRFFFTTALFTPVIDVQSDGSFDSKVISTTVTNHVVPEPSSVWLGLTTVALVVLWTRKRATFN